MKKEIYIVENGVKREFKMGQLPQVVEDNFSLITKENVEAAKQLRENVKNFKLEVVEIKTPEELEEVKASIQKLNDAEKQINAYYEKDGKIFYQLHKENLLFKKTKLEFIGALKLNKSQSIHNFLEAKRIEEERKEAERRRIELEKQRIELERIKREEEKKRIQFEREQAAIKANEPKPEVVLPNILDKVQEAQLAREEEELNRQQEIVTKKEEVINTFNTNDFKVRKRPKKLIVEISENNVLNVLTKLSNQGLNIMDYIKKLEWNNKKIEEAYNNKILNSSDAKVELVEQVGILKFN